MTWIKNSKYSGDEASFDELAAKDYLIVNGVWQTDEHGNCIMPFENRLPKKDAVDVDGLKNAATQAHDKFRTCDALSFAADDNPPCLIEFKGQNVRNIKQPEIMDKCWGSLVVLHKTLLNKHSFGDIARNLRLIVVFNSSKGMLTQFLAGKAGAAKDSFGHPVCWDLDYYSQVGLFTSVHTWSDAQFAANLSSIGL